MLWRGFVLVMSVWCSRGFLSLNGHPFLEICDVLVFYEFILYALFNVLLKFLHTYLNELILDFLLKQLFMDITELIAHIYHHSVGVKRWVFTFISH
jgi:hypothetical protein